MKKETKAFKVHNDSGLRFWDQLCVFANDVLKKKVLNEAHNSWHSVHLDKTKMFQELKSFLVH